MECLGRQTRLALTLLCNDTPPRILEIQGRDIVALHDPHNNLLERPDLGRTLLDLLLKIRTLVIQTPPLHNRGTQCRHIGLLGQNDLVVVIGLGHFTKVYRSNMFKLLSLVEWQITFVVRYLSLEM